MLVRLMAMPRQESPEERPLRSSTEVPWRRRLIHPLEALVAYAAFGVLRLRPVTAASALGGLVGRTLGPRLGVTESARRNLGRAFPEKTVPEIERIIRGMWAKARAVTRPPGICAE